MSKKSGQVIKVSTKEASLKRKLRAHLRNLGFSKGSDGSLQISGTDKEIIRNLHRVQREERLKSSRDFIKNKGAPLIKYFASGDDIDPELISPKLERVSAGTKEGDLFRLASLTWSVPVSSGFGRRLRYLVWDQNTEKLMGLIAIGDPVFNLSVRDKLIGWDANDRKDRLVNMMDAYVLGAIPPYNSLLGGKLVACLIRSREIYNDFARTYGGSTGIISKQEKKARLLAVVTSSSMGRSSVYNRLKLGDIQYLKPIGYTGGWGHFHIPDRLFRELRDYLREHHHEYADQHRYGDGPNWRLRTTRAALTSLGFKEDLLRHGIGRQVFISELATNARKILKTGKGRPNLQSLMSVREISDLALDRWVIPRSETRPEYRDWSSDDLLDLFGSQTRALASKIKKAQVTS